MRQEDQEELERSMLVRDIAEHAVRFTRAVAMARPMQSVPFRRVFSIAFSASALLFSVYSVAKRPPDIWGPAERDVPAVERDAYARVAVFLLSQRIWMYRAAEGQLPESIDYFEGVPPGVSYEVISDSAFMLTAKSDTATMLYRSNVSADSLLRDSSVIVVRRLPR